ncbi:zinc-ribbon domain-containing protein [Tropicimonas isoalkanivorans]|uniref:MJ0042 family finger-like domain-containing protein n=1 Tax=Tropicimonas isoalkanivorans TaxID=441112 RepID=A0A1I1P8C0_9RHOB|nr:zinc-ribbon domain-containing protein [Tropicimonas isoalkanivorans]SFD05936.1 MJ0042 family finger-like domain-containing protein [Tropicimonas isoalkanivorans]
MRLICPNCGAQYAVDDRVIPEAGRDVQCSNCGNTWFQRHPNHDQDLAEELTWEPAQSAPVPERPQIRPVEGDLQRPPESVVDRETEPEGEAPERVEDEAEGAEPETAEAPSHGPEPDLSGIDLPPRRYVDESVLSVLREEAEREHAARRAESGTSEYQPDLGVPPPDVGPHYGTAEYTDTGDLYGEEDGDAELKRALRASQRRGRLPDVEQITSTLEPSEAEAHVRAEDPRARRQRRRGARIGYGLAFLAFGLAALVYTRSERIASAVPETAAPLGSYVENVDAGRLWLDRTLRGFVPSDREVESDG